MDPTGAAKILNRARGVRFILRAAIARVGDAVAFKCGICTGRSLYTSCGRMDRKSPTRQNLYPG